MSTSACGVAHTSTRHLGHPARAHEPLRKLFCFFIEKVRFGALTGSCSQGPTLVFWEQVELDK